MIKNKNLSKLIKEIEKIDKGLNIFDELNSFQAKILKILFERKTVQNTYIFSTIKTKLSRAQKYRAYKQLIEKKYIIKKNKKTLINI